MGTHWTIATLIIVMLAIGLYMGGLPRGPERLELIQIHKPIGVIVLFLGISRVLWRLFSGFPGEISALPAWQTIASKSLHYMLLAAIIIMPFSGYISSPTGRHPVSFFGFF